MWKSGLVGTFRHGRRPKEEDDQTSGIICGCSKRSRGDRKAKSFETLSNSFMYKVVFLGDPALGMKNLHAMGPSSIGDTLVLFRVRSTVQVAAFRPARWPSRYWQGPCSVSSPVNSSSGRAENGKVVYLATSTPGRLLRIHPRNAVAWVRAPASLSS